MQNINKKNSEEYIVDRKVESVKTFNMKKAVDKGSKWIFLLSALIAVFSLLLIMGFVFYKGLRPFFAEGYSFVGFITGIDWYPSSSKFGILPMIIATILGTIGALLIGVPIGLLTSIFISEIAPKKVASIIVPWIKNTFNLPKGQSLLAVIIVLAIMMLPTIISVATTAIRAVPKSYKEGSLALGASYIETTFKVVVPAAKSGILAAVILGIGRAVGETMAIILVAGNSANIPTSIFDGVRPLTSNIALEMGYAYGTHQEMLFATGVVLFIFILILNLVIAKLSNKEGK